MLLSANVFHSSHKNSCADNDKKYFNRMKVKNGNKETT